MAALKWTGESFKILGLVLTAEAFEAWVKRDGKKRFEEMLKKIPARWFFGKTRTKRILFTEATNTIKNSKSFAAAVAEKLDQLPSIIGKIGIAIRKKGHKDLFSVDSSKALVVVPRALALSEFKIFLVRHLGAPTELARFPGLAKYFLEEVGEEAERLFFEETKKGRQFLLSSGKAMLLGVDPDYGWYPDGLKGHYFFGYAGKNGRDLNKKKDLKKFKSEMEEFLVGQKIHLSRLRSTEIHSIRNAFRSR